MQDLICISNLDRLFKILSQKVKLVISSLNILLMNLKKLLIWVSHTFYPRFIRGYHMFLGDLKCHVVERQKKRLLSFWITAWSLWCRKRNLTVRLLISQYVSCLPECFLASGIVNFVKFGIQFIDKNVLLSFIKCLIHHF